MENKRSPLVRMDKNGKIGPVESAIMDELDLEETRIRPEELPIKGQKIEEQPLQQSSPQAKEQAQQERPKNTSQMYKSQPSNQKDQVSSTPPKGGASTKPRGKEGDYYTFFRERFGPLIVLILWVSMADLDRASFFAPTPEECEEIAPHAARLAVKVEGWLNVPSWAHDAIVSSDDVVSIGLILVGYLDRIGVLTKIKPYFMRAAQPKQRTEPNGQNSRSNGSLQGAGEQPIPFGIGLQYFPD